jgi:Icc-related predicted phosphoesterase
MTSHPQKLLALAEPNAALPALERALAELTADVDMVAVVGSFTVAWSKPSTYRETLKLLGAANLPVFWVPGPLDAPIQEYLSECFSLEIAFPLLRGVHGTFALGPHNVLFAGMGGEIRDAPDTRRAEEFLLRYPAWEAEYRLKVIRDLKPYERVFLFTTPPAHKGLRSAGSDVLAELVKTYDPVVVITGGETPEQVVLGTSLVVAPGRLDRGHYAIVDLHRRSAEPGRLELTEVEREPVATGDRGDG